MILQPRKGGGRPSWRFTFDGLTLPLAASLGFGVLELFIEIRLPLQEEKPHSKERLGCSSSSSSKLGSKSLIQLCLHVFKNPPPPPPSFKSNCLAEVQLNL